MQKLTRRVRKHYGHAFPLFVRWVVEHSENWSYWKTTYQEFADLYAAESSTSSVAGRLATYYAAITCAAMVLHRALDAAGHSLPWKWLTPLYDLWDTVASETATADVDIRALQAIRSWAESRQQQFWGRHAGAGYSYAEARQPFGGWLGRWEAGEDWQYIAFLPEGLRDFLKDSQFQPDEVLPSLKGRTDAMSNSWAKYTNVRWGAGGEQTKMWRISRVAFEAAEQATGELA